MFYLHLSAPLWDGAHGLPMARSAIIVPGFEVARYCATSDPRYFLVGGQLKDGGNVFGVNLDVPICEFDHLGAQCSVNVASKPCIF